MKFSIIIPAYNASNHIEKVLSSIAYQSFKNYELIVVCDSCTDNTEAIAKSYGAKTIPVNFHNDGLSRSIGLDNATGDWVLFLDDDDWWLHEFVLEQLNEKLTDDIDILCFAFVWKGIKYCSPKSVGGNLYPAVWNKCWKRSFIGDTRFPNIYSVSDYRFHLAMMKKNPRLYFWDMPMYYYNYLREGSISYEMGHTIEETKKYWSEN